MIITLPWLKEHLKTNANENEIINKLTNIGLEVESIKENSGELGNFKIAKISKLGLGFSNQPYLERYGELSDETGTIRKRILSAFGLVAQLI